VKSLPVVTHSDYPKHTPPCRAEFPADKFLFAAKSQKRSNPANTATGLHIKFKILPRSA
jgi:hypothetical protein